MDQTFQSKIEKLKVLIDQSRHTTIFTGAGISTTSGIPDFRTPGKGLWEKVNPMEIVSITSFKRDPVRFYNWFHDLLSDMVNAKPNIAHQMIASLQHKGRVQSVITQNIDLLHQSAGTKDVITLHGSIGTFSCLPCKRSNILDQSVLPQFIAEKIIPRCEHCGSYLKPNIVFFEEMLPQREWKKANEAALETDLFITIGSSLEVYPANQIPNLAFQNGAKIIINTLSPTPLDHITNLLLPYEITKVWEALSDI